MTVEFFRRSVELVERFRRPDQVVQHTFQTNGILLDDEWCTFFKKHNFLVGLSVDGPREIHDTYRKDRRGTGTFDLVMKGWAALRQHNVDFNILCTVNAANQHHGRDVYRFFRDELKANRVQFIPIVERATEETLAVANQGWSEQPGKKRLLYTQTGNLALEDYFGRHLLCIHAPTCGYGPALEHNGDFYSCDHFVELRHLLGNKRRGAGPQLPVSGPRAVLHAHRPGLPDDGPAAPGAPGAIRRDGVDGFRRRKAWSLSPMPLRERQEVSFQVQGRQASRRPLSPG